MSLIDLLLEVSKNSSSSLWAGYWIRQVGSASASILYCECIRSFLSGYFFTPNKKDLFGHITKNIVSLWKYFLITLATLALSSITYSTNFLSSPIESNRSTPYSLMNNSLKWCIKKVLNFSLASRALGLKTRVVSVFTKI